MSLTRTKSGTLPGVAGPWVLTTCTQHDFHLADVKEQVDIIHYFDCSCEARRQRLNAQEEASLLRHFWLRCSLFGHKSAPLELDVPHAKHLLITYSGRRRSSTSTYISNKRGAMSQQCAQSLHRNMGGALGLHRYLHHHTPEGLDNLELCDQCLQCHYLL